MGIYQKIKKKIKDKIPIAIVSFLILLCIFFFLFKRIVIIIGPGEAGVLYRLFLGGTVTTEVYPEGIRFVWPFDEMYIYNVRIQETATELDVLTQSGLEVHLYLSIRYAPEYKLVGVLHKTVGPDYVNRVIIPEIESVLREVIGTMKAEEIYTTGREVITMAIEEAIEQVAQRYINVDDVIIKRIELPPEVADTIRFKIKQKHLVEAHEFIVDKEVKEAERKRIEGQGVRDQNKIITESLSDQRILTWHGIQAVRAFAKAENSTVVIVGGGEKGLPIIGNLPLGNFQDVLPSGTDENNGKEEASKQAAEVLPPGTLPPGTLPPGTLPPADQAPGETAVPNTGQQQ